MPGRPLYLAGVNSRSVSHCSRQLSPIRSLPSTMMKGRSCFLRWWPTDKPAWPAPTITVSMCWVVMTPPGGLVMTLGTEATQGIGQEAHSARRPHGYFCARGHRIRLLAAPVAEADHDQAHLPASAFLDLLLEVGAAVRHLHD